MTSRNSSGYTKLQEKVKKRHCLTASCFRVGIVFIVLLAASTSICNYFLSDDTLLNNHENGYKRLLLGLCCLEVISTSILFYALSLMFIAIRIMRASANKTGNANATKDVFMIVLSAALMTSAVVINFLSFIILAILRYKGVAPFRSQTGQRDSWTCVFQTIITFLLFTADLILIRIFWSYVINVNKTLKEIEEAASKSNQNDTRDTIKSIGSALGI